MASGAVYSTGVGFGGISLGLFDVIGPVMVGPSSSHTAGAVRLGNFARLVLGGEPRLALIGLHGSLAATGEGHGTHLAILAGIMGLTPDDERIPQARDLAEARGLEYSFSQVDLGEVHPNSARLTLRGREMGGVETTVCGSSVGGGAVRIWRLDEFEVDLAGRYPTLLLIYPDHPGVVAAVSGLLADRSFNIAEMKVHRTTRGGRALMALELDQAPDEETIGALRGLPDMAGVRFIPDLEAI